MVGSLPRFLLSPSHYFLWRETARDHVFREAMGPQTIKHVLITISYMCSVLFYPESEHRRKRYKEFQSHNLPNTIRYHLSKLNAIEFVYVSISPFKKQAFLQAFTL